MSLILIYGKPKAGKTTTVLKAVNKYGAVLLEYDEHGEKSVPDSERANIAVWPMWKKNMGLSLPQSAIDELRKLRGSGKKIVVVDTITHAVKSEQANIEAKYKRMNQALYGVVKRKAVSFLQTLESIFPVVVLIAQAVEKDRPDTIRSFAVDCGQAGVTAHILPSVGYIVFVYDLDHSPRFSRDDKDGFYYVVGGRYAVELGGKTYTVPRNLNDLIDYNLRLKS